MLLSIWRLVLSLVLHLPAVVILCAFSSAAFTVWLWVSLVIYHHIVQLVLSPPPHYSFGPFHNPLRLIMITYLWPWYEALVGSVIIEWGIPRLSLVSVLMYCATVYFVRTAIMCSAVAKCLSVTTVCIVFINGELLHEEWKRQSVYPNPHLPPVSIPCHVCVCVMVELSFPP